MSKNLLSRRRLVALAALSCAPVLHAADALPPVVVTVVTLLHASPLSPSLLVASRLRPTMHASVLHALRVDFL